MCVSVCLTYCSTKQSSLTVQKEFAFSGSTQLVLYQCAIQLLDMYSFYTDACVCVCDEDSARPIETTQKGTVPVCHLVIMPASLACGNSGNKFYDGTLGFFYIFFFIVLHSLEIIKRKRSCFERRM